MEVADFFGAVEVGKRYRTCGLGGRSLDRPFEVVKMIDGNMKLKISTNSPQTIGAKEVQSFLDFKGGRLTAEELRVLSRHTSYLQGLWNEMS